MYPRRHHSLYHKLPNSKNHSQYHENTESSYGVHDIGNAQLLEMIYIRKNIYKLLDQAQSFSQESFLDEITSSLKLLESLFYHLLKKLSAYIEVPTCSALYKPLLTGALPYFEQFFSSMKVLGLIIEKLMKTAALTGQHPNKYFQVELALSDMIADFSALNKDWLESMLLRSNSFEEYLKLKCQELKPQVLVRSEEFRVFHHQRKESLRILHRSL